MDEVEKLRRLTAYMRSRLEWFAEHSWNADEANHQHEQALKGLAKLEKELENDYGLKSSWKDKTGNGWTGHIEKGEDGYEAVCMEGFGTYDTLEEAEKYMIENDYEKVN